MEKVGHTAPSRRLEGANQPFDRPDQLVFAANGNRRTCTDVYYKKSGGGFLEMGSLAKEEQAS